MRQAYVVLSSHGIPLASNQVHYNLLHRYPETNGVLSACRELDVTLIAYSPLEQGVLSGKYRSGAVSMPLAICFIYYVGQLDPFKETGNSTPVLRRLFSRPHLL